MGRRREASAKPPSLAPPAVDGLAQGRDVARRRAGRRQLRNRAVSTVLFAVVLGALGVAAYAGWQFYGDEQDRNSNNGGGGEHRTPEEVIDHLEEQPRWNGPGTPGLGVGEEPRP